MHTSMKWFTTVAIALAMSTTAAAQDPVAGDGTNTNAGYNETPNTYAGVDTTTAAGTEVAVAGTTYPVQVGARPLVTPQGTLTIVASPLNPFRLDGGLSFTHAGTNFSGDLPITLSTPTIVSMNAGVSYAPIDNLEVGAMVLPVQLTNGAGYNNPTLYGVYRFMQGTFEMGGGLALSLPVQSGTKFGVTLALPMYYHMSATTRLETGVLFGMYFSDPMRNSLYLPIGVTTNVTDNIFLGVRTGLQFSDLSNAGDTLALPLYLQGGYTVASSSTGGPLLDLVAQFGFPTFLALGASDPVSKLQTAYWQLTFGANVYLNM
ncbi:MAG: hypothetical protein IPK60_15445 [Sandaracinaceae bacterium]|nr:hypothetical protein [Sandaracinaceae bacterium]